MSIRLPNPSQRIPMNPAGVGVVGSITHQVLPGGMNRLTIPAAGAAMTDAASAPGFLWWRSGFTVSDILNRYAGVRLRDVSAPGGTGANAVLGTALLFRASGTPALTDDFFWAQNIFGYQSTANTQAEVVCRKSTNSIIGFAQVPAFSHSDLMARLHSVGLERETFVGHFTGAGQRTVHTITDATAMTDSHEVYCVVIAGRSAVAGSPVDIDFGIDFIPPLAS